jgi:polyhydroxyalkanoate synthesis regulator phasin
MQGQIGELRRMLDRLLMRLDTTPDPHEMFKLQKTIKELERKIQDLEAS